MHRRAQITTAQDSINKSQKSLSCECLGHSEEKSLLIWVIRLGCFCFVLFYLFFWEEMDKLVLKDG